MGDIVDLALVRAERELRTVGPCRCLSCGTEWNGSVPAGTVDIECPECHLMTGMRAGLCVRQEDDHWTCACGNQFFHLVTDGVYCPCCARQWGWGDFGH